MKLRTRVAISPATANHKVLPFQLNTPPNKVAIPTKDITMSAVILLLSQIRGI